MQKMGVVNEEHKEPWEEAPNRHIHTPWERVVIICAVVEHHRTPLDVGCWRISGFTAKNGGEGGDTGSSV